MFLCIWLGLNFDSYLSLVKYCLYFESNKVFVEGHNFEEGQKEEND